MSLTTYVKTEEIGHRIDTIFPKPQNLSNAPLLAPPNTKNYMLMGTAFDYIMRFWLQRNYPNVERKNWVAKSALDRLGTYSSFLQIAIEPSGMGMVPMFVTSTREGGQQIYTSVHEALEALPSDPGTFNKLVETTHPPNFGMSAFDEYCLMKQCESILRLAEDRVNAYCRTGEMINELLMSAIDLAKLDGIFRSLTIPADLGRYDVGDVQDLRRLYEVIPEDEFKDHDRVLLNPTFGQASRMVGGADADLILDGRLIDIKTTKYLEIKTDAWRQIVGYGVLADLARTEDKKFPKIDEIGIYFSRHGKLWTVPASQIYKKGEYGEFRRFFIEYARKSNPWLKFG